PGRVRGRHDPRQAFARGRKLEARNARIETNLKFELANPKRVIALFGVWIRLLFWRLFRLSIFGFHAYACAGVGGERFGVVWRRRRNAARRWRSVFGARK